MLSATLSKPVLLTLPIRLQGGEYSIGEQLRRRVFEAVGAQVRKLEVDGKADWQAFSGEDRSLVRIGLLHNAYYQCYSDFDDFILQQIESKEPDLPIFFAKDILTLLCSRGFNTKEALRYFSFFYQLRRAWYFIHHGLLGQSNSMVTLRSHLWRSVFTSFPGLYEKSLWSRMEDFSTFLVGETGTGKGTAAAAIGRSGFIPFIENKRCFSESFTSNFIEVNLSQFSESLIESELFGHKKGSFTGAVGDHKGVFSLCSPYGSIFLDEIGDVSIPIQIKLLKVLEERSFVAVGGHNKLFFKGRIISATNRSLADLQEQSTFRQDFYYRLCSNVIEVPPLRQQIAEDPATLEILLAHTVQRITGETIQDLQDQVIEIIHKEVGTDYNWPGNVRELEQAVRSIILTKHYNIDTGWQYNELQNLHHGIEKESLSARQLISGYCRLLYNKYGTFEKVAEITELDPRTVKKHLSGN